MIIPIKLPKEDKEAIVHKVQAYFETERGETIGSIAAEQLIDMMVTELGPYLYNKAIFDARALILEKTSQIEDELYSLERPTRGKR